MLDQLTLSSLRVQGTLEGSPRDGVLHDRTEAPTPTPLEVDLELHVDLESAGRTDDIAHTVDLALVARVVEAIATDGHWSLLETLGLAIVRTLLLPPAPGEARARIDALTLRIRRSAWMRSHATPGIVLHRARHWCTTERRVLGPGVAADIIAETRHTELFRVRLTPGARFTLPPGAVAIQLTDTLLDGRTVTAPGLPGAVLVVVRR